MATYYRTGVETYSIIGTADEKDSLEGRIPDGSTYFAVDENMFYTFYDGTWYETLPEAARLYHDDVGTDTRPIKLVGGVATVVANELAEDSKVVHKTGDETVDGEKTFIKTLRAYKLRSEDTTEYGSTQNKGALIFSAKGANGNLIDYGTMFLWQTLSGTGKGNSLTMHVRSLDGAQDKAAFTAKVMDDYTTRIVVLSHLPVDGSGNHLTPDSTEIINSEMLAVDPRVIHTTGNETISGLKSTTSSLALLSNSMDLDSPPSYTSRGFKEYKVKNGSQVVVREDATLATAGNAHRIIVHAHTSDGTDISATLAFVVYRDGTCRLGLTKPDGTEVNIVPRG